MAFEILFILLPTIISITLYIQSVPVEQSNEEFLETYDFIVVGAGSAGSVVASRLSEIEDQNILVLEAGGDESDGSISDIPLLSAYNQLTSKDWQYVTEPQEQSCLGMVDKRSKWPRGKGVGGSSVLNNMLYQRGNKHDFDSWESLGNAGWGYKNVIEYYKKSEDNKNCQLTNSGYHGTGGYLTVSDPPYRTSLVGAFMEAGVKLGYAARDTNGEFQTGFTQVQGTTRDGGRCSSGKAFLKPARQRKNLRIGLEAHVTKVLIDSTTKIAYGVEFIRKGTVHRISVTKEVILTTGAIASPQLLMLSGIGPKEDLQNLGIPVIKELKVGQNLQDQISLAGLTFVINRTESLLLSRVALPGPLLQYATSKTGPLAVLGGIEASACVNTKYADTSIDYPDIQIRLFSGGVHMDGGTQLKRCHGLTDDFYDKVYKPIHDKDAYTFIPTLLRPKSRGHIKLCSNNPLDHPLINPNYFSDESDIKTLLEGVKIAVQISQTTSLLAYSSILVEYPDCAAYNKYSDESWECMIRHYTQTSSSPSGTCKMGPDWDTDAVVSSELKVHGIQGLRVIDASIMPTVISADISATIIMIAEKGCDLVKQSWSLSSTTKPPCECDSGTT